VQPPPPNPDGLEHTWQQAEPSQRVEVRADRWRSWREQREAERRRRQEEDARKPCELTFLGRGVSAGLADRRSAVEKLTDAGLPVLSTPAELAQAMGLTIRQLRWLAY